MPGPYTFPTDRVTGGPAPAADVNALGAALNEAASLATPEVLMLRDADGRARVAAPLDSADVANAGWVAGAIGSALGSLPGIPEYVGPAEGASARWNISPASPSNTSLGGGTTDMKVAPMPIYGPCKLRSFTFQVTTAGDAGSLIHWWLFVAGGTHGSVPDELVQAFAGVPGDATGQVTITPASPIPLYPGYYMMLVGGSNVTTTAPGVQASNSTMSQELMFRTRNANRLDLMTRGGTNAVGINVDAGAPATIDWNFSASTPHLIDVSGGRFPLMLLDLIDP